ncbi:nucleotide-diphospho-sugar transferase, partial [Polyplosphaeria fusca]
EPEFPFQDELDLDLPIDILQSFSTYPPQNYNPNSPKYAYATFMATRSPSLKDPYYLAIHSLIHRLLWSPRSRSTSHPFIVYVASFVTPTQRALLSGAGALVRDLAPLDWNPSVPGIQHRWKDLFAKLNMWNDTEFERIAFLDADAFPVQNIDAMFDVAPAQPCVADRLTLDDVLSDGSSVCEDYVFAGVPQDPFNATHPNINVGSMVFSPSKRMHERLLRNYGKTDRYDCLMAEQAFLNWQFEASGAFPASVLEREWGGFFPGEGEEGRLRVVHEKIWMEGGWLGREWEVGWKEMVGFYGSEGFAGAR